MATSDASLEVEKELIIDHEERWRQIELELKDDDVASAADTSINGAGDEAMEIDEGVKKYPKTPPVQAAPVTTEDGLVLKSCNLVDDENYMFTMPNAGMYLLDMARYRQYKKVNIHPLTLEDLYHPTIVKLMKSNDCLESRLHFYRDSSAEQEAQGLLTLIFSTKQSYESAVTELKEVRAELQVDTVEQPNEKKLIPLWNRKSKESTGENLRSRTVCICNRPDSVTREMLAKYFPTADEIFIPLKHGPQTRSPAYAFALYETTEEADEAVKQYITMKPHIAGTTLGVYKYRIGGQRPEGLLSLPERMFALRHGSRSAEIVAKLNKGETVKSPDLAKHKLKKCTELIEVDNQIRRAYGMTLPNHKTLTKILPSMNGEEANLLMQKLGITYQAASKSGPGPSGVVKPPPSSLNPNGPLVLTEPPLKSDFTEAKRIKRLKNKANKAAASGFGTPRGGMGAMRGSRFGRGAMGNTFGGRGGMFGGVKRPYGQIQAASQQQQHSGQQMENLYATMIPIVNQLVKQQQQQHQQELQQLQQQSGLSHRPQLGRGRGRGRGGPRSGGGGGSEYSALSRSGSGMRNQLAPSGGGQWNQLSSANSGQWNEVSSYGGSQWDEVSSLGGSQWNEVKSPRGSRWNESLLPAGTTQWNQTKSPEKAQWNEVGSLSAGGGQWNQVGSSELGQWNALSSSNQMRSAMASSSITGGGLPSYDGYSSQGYNNGRDNQYGGYDELSHRAKYSRWS